MYIVPKFQTGDRKGQNIMNEIEEGNRWSDMWNDIFVHREHDKDWNHLDTFQVAERRRGNTHTIWDTGLTFDSAMDLACRLTVGKEYIPPKREDMKLVPYFEYEVGDLIPGNMHMHQINDNAFGQIYIYDNDSRVEIHDILWESLITGLKKDPAYIGNKHGVIVGMPTDEEIPAVLLIAYMYDDRYFTAILHKKG